MGSTILKFDDFSSNLKESFNREEMDRMKDTGLDSAKKFRDAFSVLDFFGGSLPDSYESAEMEARQAGYELSAELFDEAAMMAQDGAIDYENEEDGVFEATDVEVAQRKAAIEAEDAEISKAEADLEARESNIKPLDPNSMTQKATIAADRAALEVRKADLAKKRAEVAALKVVPTPNA
jgi:hypothetical protein